MIQEFAAVCWRLKHGNLEILLNRTDDVWSIPSHTLPASQFSDGLLDDFIKQQIGLDCQRSAREVALPVNFDADTNGGASRTTLVPFQCRSRLEAVDKFMHWTPVDRASNLVHDDLVGKTLAFINKRWSFGKLDSLRDS